MDSMTSLLGLALRAGRLAVGEEPVGAACRAHKAYLLLLACDAADNTIRRAHQFTQAVKTIPLTLPLDKAALGGCLGRESCAMVALTDVGLASAAAKKLEAADPAVRQRLEYKAEKTLRRRRETWQRAKAVQAGQRKPWASPPQEKKPL